MNTRPPTATEVAFDEAAFVAVGSNLPGSFGPPEQMARRALRELRRLSTRPPLCSSLHQTSPRDCAPGTPDFINAVAALWPPAELTPEALLDELLRIETRFGRTRPAAHNAPRTLDLDLLAWGDKVIHTTTLQLPHPGLSTRDFVLAPLAELAPNWVPPGQPHSISTLLQALSANIQRST